MAVIENTLKSIKYSLIARSDNDWKSISFEKGTKYLDNLLTSTFAVFLISMLMVFMFRSFKMVVVSLIPNLLPLMITAGLMGYFGIPLKPSTILVLVLLWTFSR
jgi:preprotein translocase subunit SecF